MTTEHDLCAQLVGFVGAEAGFDIDPDGNFFATGLTSAQLVGVHGRLCAALDRALPVYLLVTYPTCRSLARRLAAPDIGVGAAVGAAGAPTGWTPQARRALRGQLRQQRG
jgi:hypothetical protein